MMTDVRPILQAVMKVHTSGGIDSIPLATAQAAGIST
jgi:hypothetical protein